MKQCAVALGIYYIKPYLSHTDVSVCCDITGESEKCLLYSSAPCAQRGCPLFPAASHTTAAQQQVKDIIH